jgi:hypothetical protein
MRIRCPGDDPGYAASMKVTVRHYYDFGAERSIVGADVVTPDSWDGLRTRTTGAFSLPATRAEFDRMAQERTDIAERARSVDAWLESRDVEVVSSYGVGGAALEWWLNRLRPERKLIVTDYGSATTARLDEVFPTVEVRRHDLRSDEPVPADVHVFHRIDTELTNHEWREVFRRFRNAEILLIATQVLDLRALVSEIYNRVAKRGRASRAGFVRNRAAFEALWRSTHIGDPLVMHDLHAWALSPKSNQPPTAAAATRWTSSS